MTTAFEYLTQGDFVNMFLQVWTNAGVPSDIIMLGFLTFGCAIIYVKSKDLGLVGLTIMITSPFIISYITPISQLYFVGIIIFGISSLIYWFYKSR